MKFEGKWPDLLYYVFQLPLELTYWPGDPRGSTTNFRPQKSRARYRASTLNCRCLKYHKLSCCVGLIRICGGVAVVGFLEELLFLLSRLKIIALKSLRIIDVHRIDDCQLCCIQKWCADDCYISLVIIQTWKEVTGFSEAVLVVILNPVMAPSPSVAAIGARQEAFGPPEAAAAGRGGFYYICYFLSISYFCGSHFDERKHHTTSGIPRFVWVRLVSKNKKRTSKRFVFVSVPLRLGSSRFFKRFGSRSAVRVLPESNSTFATYFQSILFVEQGRTGVTGVVLCSTE